MLDFNYFKTQLALEANLTENQMVEVVLTNGHAHHVRSVLDVRDGHVVLEVFLRGVDSAVQRPHWKRDAGPGEARSTAHAAIAYESIAAVVVGPAHEADDRQVGFAGR